MRNIVHKILAGLLCLCLILCHIPGALATEAQTTVYINNLEDFLTFAENCRLDSYSQSKKFVLTVDIDLSGIEFDGIPVFCGTLDGNWHTIAGLQIDSAGSGKGLFRCLQETAVVKNLAVKGNVVPTGSQSDVGGIAGTNAGVIENCSFDGQVSGDRNVGGIVGKNLTDATVSGCTVLGIVSGKHFAGGIAGNNAGKIQGCTNRANVNVTVQQNSVDISDITIESLLDTESAIASTDIGGIAGYSEGMLLRCKNFGAIGYPHMGYNVGGIAGMQRGYVAECVNYGDIRGRKEVGGIIGQQEPQILLRYSTDTLQILKAQFAALSELIHATADHVDSNAVTIKNILSRMEKHMQALDSASEILEEGIQAPKLEDLKKYLDTLESIRQSIQGLEDCLAELLEAVDTTSVELEADLRAISLQLSAIEATLNNAEDHLGGNITDISDADTDTDLASKAENCSNYGTVSGDLHVGGIVGIIAFENDLDPEEDITVEGDMTLNAVGNFRSVIRACQNSGRVNAKKSHAGGIVGWLSMGLVHSCVNSASLENAAADYVGGIAGESAGFIRNCKVRGILHGDMYVGGICGSGSIVTDCLALVAVSGTERTGGILGLATQPNNQVPDPIHGNFYLSHGADPGAIDGISYAGQAEGLPREEFFQKAELFTNVTITFLANGEVVLRTEIPTGSAFSQIPDVPQLPGSTGVWDGIEQIDFACVLFDLTIHARYITNETVMQGDYTDEHDRPVLLLQGNFALQAAVHVTQTEDVPGLQADQNLLLAWNFTAEHCLQLQAGRLLIPDGTDTENVILLVRDKQGNWNRREFSRSDSYLVFSLEEGEDGVALVQIPEEKSVNPWFLAGCGAVVVLLAVMLLCICKHRRRKQKETATTAE